MLLLGEDGYADHGVFRRGRQARSACLADCALDAASVFDAA